MVLGIRTWDYIDNNIWNETHHSEIVIHGLESAAEQFAGFWVTDLSNAPTILRVPDTQSSIQRCWHDDVIAERPSKVCDRTAVTFQGHLYIGRGRRQRHDGQGSIQWAARKEVFVVICKLQPWN